MPDRIHVLLVLLVLLDLVLLVRPAGTVRVRKTRTQTRTRTRSCLDLPDEVLDQMFGRLSVGVLSAFHHALQLEPQDQNLTCPTRTRTGTGTRTQTGTQTGSRTRLPVNLLSVSPWAYRLTYDPARYPRYVPEAYCLCRGCLTGPQGQEDPQHRSTPVYAPSVVLRRAGSCLGGRQTYTETYVSIAVGCTCVPLQDQDRDGQTRTRTKTRRPGSAGNRV